MLLIVFTKQKILHYKCTFYRWSLRVSMTVIRITCHVLMCQDRWVSVPMTNTYIHKHNYYCEYIPIHFSVQGLFILVKCWSHKLVQEILIMLCMRKHIKIVKYLFWPFVSISTMPWWGLVCYSSCYDPYMRSDWTSTVQCVLDLDKVAVTKINSEGFLQFPQKLALPKITHHRVSWVTQHWPPTFHDTMVLWKYFCGIAKKY